MSGLAALFQRDGRPADEAAVRAMLDAVPYRGPDGFWTWVSGPVGLGHAKMAVTPEDGSERQPLVSPRTGCAIVADVRLDNRDDLLALLPEPLYPEIGDAELILRAYEHWGMDAAARLLGDFAFVIWDPREQRLIGARDTSGQRGLFYRIDHRTFAAASEIHQLFQNAEIPVVPNDERIRDFLVPLNMFTNEKDGPATFYDGIAALPAGHVIVVDRESVRLRRYWELQPPAEIRYRADDDYAEHFRSLFFEAVRARLRSAHPVGVMLSGGLDSSSIACVAQELYRAGRAADRGFAGFSFTFEGLECDERDFVAEIPRKYGFTVHSIPSGDYTGRLQLAPRGFLESPNMGISGPRDLFNASVSQSGVRALLSGEIADSCVYGSHLVFDSLLRRGRLGAAWQRIRAYRRVSEDSLRRIVGLYCIAPLLPLELQKHLLAAYQRRFIARNQAHLTPPWLAEPLRDDLHRRLLYLSQQRQRGRKFASPARQQEYDLLYPPEVARYPVPWPIERARPFADRRLHEFLLAIPPEQKFAPHPETDEFYAGSKRLVRRAMRGILPERIRTRRSKTIFSAVVENEVTRNWAAYEAAFGPSARPEVAVRGYVEQGAFWSRLQAARDGVQGGDVMYVMQVVGLETWLRTFALPRAQLVTVPPAWPTAAELANHDEMAMPASTA